ncbi:2-deoxyglucose-6-phosphatase [Vibrio sp. UCD-FRSSP16_10]|nr:2-deoxyglucose-6-phosphatase [Vibrio sp. UCD-FRSSP16_30]OBT20492.1 2-deoxyglucose-6-phosphatase [Vibrio sp. UCD-FRSSP16_10]
MDGLMVNSEPYWRQAQLDVLPKYGVTITLEDCIATTGVRIDNIVEIYYKKFPWQGPTQDEVCLEICNRVIALIKQHKPEMPGLKSLLKQLKTRNVKLAVASSSPMNLIVATIQALELEQTFDEVLSAQDLAYGKPHPEVYLNTANALGVCPTECLAFEDSLTGLLAAKAARMKTIVVPEKGLIELPQWSIADKAFSSLEEVTVPIIESILLQE